jgi:hypothetical protein
MENTEADSDLDLRNFILDGVNGFDMIQTNDMDDSPED